jgi:thiamine-phosphate pyrophosphorylase
MKVGFGPLYGIVDLGYVAPSDVARVTQSLIAGGVDILQLRAKRCTEGEVLRLAELMLPLTQAGQVPLVINDYPHIAAKIGAEGVHVGQDDDAVAKARDIVGRGCFVGKSTHSMAQAEAALAEGADYIGFGPLYATGTKPDYVPIGLEDIAEVHRRVSLPIYCIGGVNPSRLAEIQAAGARRVVVVSAFLQARDIEAEVAQLRASLVA